MTQAPMLSMSGGRARSSFPANCHVDRWLGGHDVSVIGATVVGETFAAQLGYSPKTTAKRNTPGNLAGGLT